MSSEFYCGVLRAEIESHRSIGLFTMNDWIRARKFNLPSIPIKNPTSRTTKHLISLIVITIQLCSGQAHRYSAQRSHHD